jgi:hypothetical protein
MVHAIELARETVGPWKSRVCKVAGQSDLRTIGSYLGFQILGAFASIRDPSREATETQASHWLDRIRARCVPSLWNPLCNLQAGCFE